MTEENNGQPNFQVPSAIKTPVTSITVDPETGSRNGSIQHTDQQGNSVVEKWVDRVAKNTQTNENEGR